MPWVERTPDTYSAYAGPDVGGFGLLPQSAVPKLSPDPNLPSELGLQSIDEPLSSLTKDVPVGDLPPLPSASAASRVGNWVERGTAAPQLAASTVAPKGGTPYQPSLAGRSGA